MPSLLHAQLDEFVREFESAAARLGRLRLQLSDAAWGRRPAPDRWSPGECIAHLNLTSTAVLPLVRQGLDEARRRGPTPRTRYRRDLVGWLLWRALSSPGRFKSKTAAPFVPSGDHSADELVTEFERLQAAQIGLVHEAEGWPIDRVKIVSPFNARVRYNVFSALSILPRHQHRHLWQAEAAARSQASPRV